MHLPFSVINYYFLDLNFLQSGIRGDGMRTSAQCSTHGRHYTTSADTHAQASLHLVPQGLPRGGGHTMTTNHQFGSTNMSHLHLNPTNRPPQRYIVLHKLPTAAILVYNLNQLCSIESNSAKRKNSLEGSFAFNS